MLLHLFLNREQCTSMLSRREYVHPCEAKTARTLKCPGSVFSFSMQLFFHHAVRLDLADERLEGVNDVGADVAAY